MSARTRNPSGNNNLASLASPITSSRILNGARNVMTSATPRPGTTGGGSMPTSGRYVGNQQPTPRGDGYNSYRSNGGYSSRQQSGRNSNNMTMTMPQQQTVSGIADSDDLQEVLRQMRDKSNVALFEKDQAEIDALGEYNEYSRPRPSITMPLRSCLLDPEVNNFPKSKTRTELMHKIRVSGGPHSSYDLDHDGWVSQEDYKLSKRFDFDGNGVLDPEERQVGKRVLADEFFKKHSKKEALACFGPSFATNTHKENVDNLARSTSFERSYEKLKSIERTMKATSAKPVHDCMSCTDDTLTKHNYYVDKFDTTAWNDFDAIPRSSSEYGLTDHGGSRKRLLFSKRQINGSICESKLEKFYNSRPLVQTRRLALITNVACENG